MHIVIANQWYPPESGWGGVAMYNYAVAHAYRELGHQVTIVASRANPTIPAENEESGIRILRLLIHDAYRLRHLPGLGYYVRPLQQMLYARRIHRTLQELYHEQPYDIVEFAEVNAEGFFYARRSLTPVVVRCHTPTFVLKRYYAPRELEFDTRLTGACEKDLIRRAHAVTTPSCDLGNLIADECGLDRSKISVFPNALPETTLKRGSSVDARNSALTILYVGRLEYAKGIQVLIRAMPRVLHELPETHFVLIGYDRSQGDRMSQRSRIENQVIELGIRGSVEIVGEVAQSEMSTWYQRSDICVVPSVVYESFSYTCAQAMAMGRPVVAARIGGIPETVEDGVHGLIVEPANDQQLADALVRLGRDGDLRTRMGQAGRAKAEREFAPQAVANKNFSAYQQAKIAFQRAGH